MAIVIEQQSRCPICNDFIDRNKEYFLVPPLISNVKDSLFNLSDVGIHTDCINRSELKGKLLRHIYFYNAYLPPSKLKCSIDGKQIEKPEYLLFLGLLTSDDTEELHNFNYLSLNIKNINKWIDLNRFLIVVERFLGEKKWVGLSEFNMLQYIIEQINKYR
jgi:hypothetical protein